ncbi:MAG: NIL domain-containing protein [Actinomycetota bacterium]|nr:NIL domain-containing protein [Actinomycetota bacterium]
MVTEKLMLIFPPNIVKKPVVYRIVKDFDLEFNILRAEITSDLEGKMLLEIKGSKERINECKSYLVKEGVELEEAAKGIILDKDKCVNCGICISLCLGKAFYLKDNYEVNFDQNKCILCGLCLNCCPVKAIKSKI